MKKSLFALVLLVVCAGVAFGVHPMPPLPVADAGPDRTAQIHETVALDGSNSTSGFDGLQTDGRHSYRWDFGYGGYTWEGGPIGPVAYPVAGTFPATLTVCAASGACATDTANVTVSAITLGSETVLTDTGNSATNLTNLQAAIDGATATNNKVITLPAGFVARGNLILKRRTALNYCTIRTANYASLPGSTSRVSPANLSNMAILEINVDGDIVNTPTTSTSPANYYYFLGICFRKGTSTNTYTHAFVALGWGDEVALNQLTNHIIFDRCYFDGGSTTSDTKVGLRIRASDVAVVNSYFYRFKGVGLETQAVLVLMGERLNFTNNYMQGGSENFMVGGGDPSISGHVPIDIVFRRNMLEKDLGWRSGDPSYYGVNLSIKNLFELKLGKRVSVQGNLFTEHWQEDQNYAITVTVRNQDGAATWSEIAYLDFAHNKIHKVGRGMSIAATDDLEVSQHTNHILVRHNIFTGIAYYTNLGQQYQTFLLGGQESSGTKHGFDKVYIIRTSTDQNGNPLDGVGRWVEWGPSINNTNCVFRGNVAQGFINSDLGTKGDAAMQSACSSTSYTVTKNGFYRSSGTNPTDNTTVSTITDVLYTNLAGFNLKLAAGSPFLTTGLSGGRAGADTDTVDALTSGTITGVWATVCNWSTAQVCN